MPTDVENQDLEPSPQLIRGLSSALSAAKLEQLANLREQSARILRGTDRKSLAFSALPQGIPKAALTEISGRPGTGKTGLVLRVLQENPHTHVAWIEENFTVYPRAICQKNIDLNRILFVEAEKDFAWTVQQVLKSGLFEIVVLGNLTEKSLSEVQLRRLQLEVKRTQSCCILLSETPTLSGRWPITLQLALTPGKSGAHVPGNAGNHPLLEILKGQAEPG